MHKSYKTNALGRREERLAETRAYFFKEKNKGRIREQMFLYAWRNIPTGAPKWFVGVRDATREEDYHLGIDAVMTTTRGDLQFQIKGTWTALHDFQDRRGVFPQNPVIVIIVRENDSYDDIRRRTKGLIYKRWLDERRIQNGNTLQLLTYQSEQSESVAECLFGKEEAAVHGS